MSRRVEVDAAQLALLLTELRLPTVARMWPEIAERSDREGWPAARLLAALDDLLAVAPVERRPPLEAQRRRLLDGAADAGVEVVPDVQGLGSGPDVVATA